MRSLVLLAPLLLQGCCALFCGGEPKPLVPLSYRTADEALATLLAAIANNDARRIYESLSPALKAERRIDGLSFVLGWERLREQEPYLHLAGEAEVVDRRTPAADRREYLLSAYGQRFQVGFVRRAYWEVGFRTSDGGDRVGDYIDDAGFTKRILASRPEEGRLVLELRSDELEGLPAAAIDRVELAHEWKVLSFRQGTTGWPLP